MKFPAKMLRYESRSHLALSLAIGLSLVFLTPAVIGQVVPFEVLHHFAGSEGGYPLSGLIQANDTLFYGTAHSGGIFGGGTAFRVEAGGTLVPLYSFGGFIGDGSSPLPKLVQESDGNF